MKLFSIITVSFVLLSCTANKANRQSIYGDHKRLGNGYSLKNNEIYYKQSVPSISSNLPKPIKTEANYNSFVNLNYGYSKDDTNIFYSGLIIPNVDYDGFSVIRIEDGFPKITDEFLLSFSESKKQPKMRISSSMFKYQLILTLEYYAKDKYNVYYGINTINGADPETFQLLSILYSIDKNSCYYSGNPIIYSDPETFELIFGRLARDKNYVYFNGQQFSDNPSSFTILNKDYAKDNQSVWYISSTFLRNSKIDTLTVASVDDFEVISGRYAKDSKYVYINGRIIENANVESFQLLSDSWSKDDQHIFQFDKLCKEADYDTFKVTDEYIKDKNRYYDKNYRPRN